MSAHAAVSSRCGRPPSCNLSVSRLNSSTESDSRRSVVARFDFTGYVQERDEAIQRQDRAERDRQQQLNVTWVELKREAGNYVNRNGAGCQVTGTYPTIDLDTGRGQRLTVTVTDRSTFLLAYTGSEPEGFLDNGEKIVEATGDQGVMKAIVDWYEAILKGRSAR